ncbi:hypothetical protein GGI15_001213 [Coemansia interrupta]|uniref:Thioredoxin domain-containing protein n=1 Tax=Coemansia interrupta TaxID=1126814 RepID=A0A9W8LN50_9FUNG|nr:hypothetical protein GGI15_001213 [Coemansia interrupta]
MSARAFAQTGRKIVAIGRNLSEHAKELGNAVPTAPFFFLKPTSSYVLSPGKIEIPQGCVVHHEVELGVVIGKTGRDISAANAADHIAGYALALDLTARNLQDEAKKKGLPWSTAKGFDTFTPVGEFIPAAKIADPHKVRLWIEVAGQIKQNGTTDAMIFQIPQLIEHVSSIMTLEEGDLLLTGTPKGVGPVEPGNRVVAGLEYQGEELSRIVFDAVARSTVVLSASPVLGMYDAGSVVKQLGASNFDRVLSKTSQPTFVKFYAPWCGHCKNLEPEYERAASKARGVAKFYAVNCDEDRNRGLCAQYNVQGFPTLKVFTEKRTKKGSRRSVDYLGKRKASAMAKFARSLLPNLSKKIGSDELESFVGAGSLPKAILLTERTQASELWKGVSAHLDRKVKFAHIVNPDQGTIEGLGISELPAIAVFPTSGDASTVEIYSGEPKYAPLVRFISKIAYGKKSKDPASHAQKPSSQTTALSVDEIASQADLERLCVDQATSSPVPVLCIVGVVALEPEYDESRSEHAQAISELELVLKNQKLHSVKKAADSHSANDDDDYDEDSGSAAADMEETGPPFRVAWVNALSESGLKIRSMFGLSDDLPSAVAISPAKRAAAPYRGAFSGEELLAWAESCYQGHNMRRFSFELDIGNKQTEPAEAAHDEL